MRRRGAALVFAAAAGLGTGGPAAHAGVLRHCDAPADLDARQQDRLLRFAVVARGELEASGQRVALVARAGLDLQRFGERYSHAGVSLRASPNSPWSVRQLYYDCDERRPRLFDQGLAGFLFGGADPSLGRLSMVLLPQEAAAALEKAALEPRSALALLGATYSANAHAWATRYQNCNQWLAELLALAWSGVDAGADGVSAEAAPSARERAQGWLRARGYEPTVFDVGNPLLMWLGGVLPWLHDDDHPPEDLEALRFRVSMPSSIESFVRRVAPGAERIEMCHDERHIVVRRGWTPLPERCDPAPGDAVLPFDDAATRAGHARAAPEETSR